MRTRPPTIKDVAEQAGCGIATVSRVLNGTGSASMETRRKVLSAADALGFEFSALGRSLQSSSTKTIGCIVPSLANPIFAEVVQAAQHEAHREGYQLILACSEYDEVLEFQAVRTLIAKKVDGLVLTVNNAAGSKALELIGDRQLPCCLVYNRPSFGLPSWAVDNRAAAREVAGAFRSHGHVQTGFLALRFNRSDRARERYEGFAEACSEIGMAKPVLLEIEEQEGHLLELLGALLSGHQDLTGIFASNDFLALAAMKAARTLGKRIPDDLSLVGFDGISTGLLVDPRLATIETHPHTMGRGAINSVLAKLLDRPMPDQPAPATTFRFRTGGSLGPPGAGKADGREAATSLPSNE
ncbi:LacI family DNA-binding transcriptional regulator [Roseibium alexandrii]|uniref:Degradation activator n=1 Tax=Roseibium alexandrii TaxID=388408 RepID=A0A0M7A4Z3_9HYPH|nr:LacI family DNA-binding transcriptional regulator [Roseibium alexandrii]CTQ69661.1 Degradation activator [Roseibium alexandrii]